MSKDAGVGGTGGGRFSQAGGGFMISSSFF